MSRTPAAANQHMDDEMMRLANSQFVPTVIGIFVFALFMSVSLPARSVWTPVGTGTLPDIWTRRLEHGYPFTYLYRTSPLTPGGVVLWADAWALSKDVERFSGTRLVADVLIAALFAVVCGFSSNYWRRGRARFNLYVRDVVALITIVSVVFAWVAYHHQQHTREARHAARLSNRSQAYWSEGVPTWLDHLLSTTEKPWLERLIGLRVTAEELPPNEMARRLKYLSLSGTFENNDLEKIASYRQLHSVSFRDFDGAYTESGERIAIDDILRLFGTLRGLRGIELYDQDVTDQGLESLSQFPACEYLDLSYSDVTDASLTHLAKMRSLKFISLRGSGTSKQAVDELRELMPQCRIVN